MIISARRTARALNIVLIVKSSNEFSVKLTCDQVGTSRAKARVGGSRKCGCPFLLIGRIHSNNKKWTLQASFGMHNHKVASTVLGHPYAGRLTDAEQDMIVNASGMFLKPKAISDMLVKANPQNVTSRKQIANFKHNLLLKDRGNMTVCQTTLSFLHEKRYRV